MSNQKTNALILALCEKVTSRRPRTVINHILEHGFVTTEEIQALHGYGHPPRAARDIRENGVPLETFRVVSKQTGRSIAAYRFADPSKIRRGRIGGRRAFSKAFRDGLIHRYDSRDAFTGERMDRRYLQIDHRIPYEVVGEHYHEESNIEEYMLLDASSQRAKSWSCEKCHNWLEERDAAICRSCYWAFPENYTHIAGEEVRRVEIEWRGTEEAEAFDKLYAQTQRENITVAAYLKRISKS